MRRSLHILACAGACLLAAGAAQADTPLASQDLAEHLRGAELVLRGVVSSVEYRNAEPGKSNGAIPHTFVTFQIEHLYKPRPSAQPGPPNSVFTMQSITLRFIGGLDSQDQDRYMLGSDMPRFDVGDRDFLLVRRNGSSGCPLVDCDGGRFRNVGGRMYNSDGQEIVLNPDGTMSFGPRFALPDIDIDQIGPHRLVRTIDDPENEEGPQPPPSPSRMQMTDADFDAFLENMLQANLSMDELTRIPNVRSSDPGMPFEVGYGREKKPNPPGPGNHKTDPGAPADPSEQLELERFEKNGGDPRF